MSFFNAADSVDSRLSTVELGVATNLTITFSHCLVSCNWIPLFDSHLANAFVNLCWLRQLAELFRRQIIESGIALFGIDLGLCLADLLL